MNKTYKRETAWVFGFLVAAAFITGHAMERPDIIDTAKFLTPFAIAALTAALGLDAAAKQFGGR